MSDTQRNAPVDWTRLHEALRKIDEAMADALNPSPGTVQLILENRARALAQATVSYEKSGAELEIVQFELRGENFGIEPKYVREIVRLVEIVTVPGAPAFVSGVVNLRGQVLPVFEFSPFLKLGGGLADLPMLLVLGSEAPEFGVAVSKDVQIGRIRADELVVEGESRHPWIRGLTGEGMAILDGEALLADERLFV